jgi:toxin YoeB
LKIDRLSFDDSAWEQYLYWQDNDKKMLKRINSLIKEIKRNPIDGIGNPEPLKHNWSGFWSRRIDHEHRLVSQVNEDAIIIVQCRYHY